MVPQRKGRCHVGSGAVAETPWGAQILSWGQRGAIEGLGSTDATGAPGASRSRDAAEWRAGIHAGKRGAARGLSARSRFCRRSIPAPADVMESLLFLPGSCFVVVHGGGARAASPSSEELRELGGTCQTSPQCPQLRPGKKEMCWCLQSPRGSQPGPRGFKSNVGSSLGPEEAGDRGWPLGLPNLISCHVRGLLGQSLRQLEIRRHPLRLPRV